MIVAGVLLCDDARSTLPDEFSNHRDLTVGQNLFCPNSVEIQDGQNKFCPTERLRKTGSFTIRIARVWHLDNSTERDPLWIRVDKKRFSGKLLRALGGCLGTKRR